MAAESDDSVSKSARQRRSVKVSGTPAPVVSELIRHEYRHAALGMGLGLATIVGGCILGIAGAAGHTSWTAKLLGLNSTLTDAAPGVILFIVGVVLVFITRPRVNVSDVR
ncbi:MAG: hypothetical protein JWM27_3817 [Gemmatimonadetes bacterium]|nr:hypothetical protein [Gemmatimonadota bacterium]